MRPILINGLVLVSTIVVIELALRVFDPIGIEHFEEVRKYADSLTFGEAYGYLHKPGYRARLQGVDVVINEHGLRSPSVPIKKPEGTRRLLILGDSVVLGWGAPQDSIFPALLDRDLDRPGTPVDVIAAGVGSWNTRTEYEWLRARGFAFEPDVVLLLVVGNDVDPKDVGHTDVPDLIPPVSRGWFSETLRDWWQFGYQHSRILAYVQYARQFARQRSREEKGYVPSSPQQLDASLALEGIINRCAARNIPLVVFLYGDDARVQRSGVLRGYRNALMSVGVAVHTFPAAVFDERRYHNSIVDGHENAAGHRVLARAVAGVVEPLLRGVR